MVSYGDSHAQLREAVEVPREYDLPLPGHVVERTSTFYSIVIL